MTTQVAGDDSQGVPNFMGEDLRGAFDQATLGTLQRRGPGSWIGTVSNQWQVFSCGQSVFALLRCARESFLRCARESSPTQLKPGKRGP